MKIYIDLIFFLNFIFDYLLLLTVKIVLKRNTSLKKILLGGLIGSLSIIFLFLKINSFELFLFKIIISILMILISFGYKDRKYFLKNLIYLYFTSIILGGFLYFLNITFSYKNNGIIFYNNGLSINIIFFIIISPIILYLYIKQNQSLKTIANYNYVVEFKYKNKIYKYNAYLDTGNKLYDPYTKKPVILLYDKNIKIEKYFFIPYHTVEHKGLLKAFKINEIIIDKKVVSSKVIIALVNKPFKMDGVDMLLNKEYLN